MRKDIAEIYEADGEKRLKPHLAVVNRPSIANDTPGRLTVKLAELMSGETVAKLVGMVGGSRETWHWSHE